MRRFHMAFFLALISVCVLAVPAKRGLWKTVKLADGTEVRVELCGDERCKFWRSADGQVYVENTKTGTYELTDIKKIREKIVKNKKAARKAKRQLKRGEACGK